MTERVAVTKPDGSVVTVPKENLPDALAARAHVSTPDEIAREKAGGLAGEAAAPVLGAARVASGGVSDEALAGAVGLLGGRGEAGRQDALKAISAEAQAHPYSTMGGEFVGLLAPIGAGGAVTAAGGAMEAGTLGLIGEGLLGRAVSMGARGATEAALLGAQHQVSEDTLAGNHSNMEHVFGAAGKDALFGAAIGAPLGALGYGLERAGAGLLRKSPGPISDAVLDDVTGAPGAGRALYADAAAKQDAIDELVRKGATSQQAARMVDEMGDMARARSSAGPISGAIDSMADRTATIRSGGNDEMRETLIHAYRDGHAGIAAQDKILSDAALGLKKSGDEALRLVEDTLDEAQFGEKSEKMAKLVDPGRWDAQRDTVLRLAQDAQDVVDEWSSLPNRGGAEGAVSKLQKELESFLDWNGRIYRGSDAVSRDIFIRTDKMKRAIDALARWGERPYGLPEAITMPDTGIRALSDKFRNALEDADVWGQAGLAQKEWNASFSQALPRRIDFGKRFTNAIDVERGMPIRSLDAGKLREGLVRLGDPAKSLEDVTSTKAFIDGLRTRVGALEKYGALSEGQANRIAQGKTALDAFEESYTKAQKDAVAVARIRAQRLEEAGHSLGGILGLATDIATKPLTTMERLASIRQTAERFEKVLSNGIGAVFGSKPASALPRVAPLRPHADVVKEIGEVRALAGNEQAIEERAKRLVGDLPEHAPKLSAQLVDQARRALTFLAANAPQPKVSVSPFQSEPRERYSDEDVARYEALRAGALDPKSVVSAMHAGKLNREGLRAMQTVSPALFAGIQEMARKEIQRLQDRGVLDKEITYEKQGAIAAVLGEPAGPTWQPDFIAAMQSLKNPPQPSQPIGGGKAGPKRKAMKTPDARLWETGAQQIEGKDHLL